MTEDEKDERPPVAVGHVVLYTSRMKQSAKFMHAIGLRQILLDARTVDAWIKIGEIPLGQRAELRGGLGFFRERASGHENRA